MQLTFPPDKLAYIASFIAEKQLFFKVKTAYKAALPDADVTIDNITVHELTTLYQQIGAISESLASDINPELKAILLEQLLDQEGNPTTEEAGEVLQWIAAHQAQYQTALQNLIDQGFKELNQ